MLTLTPAHLVGPPAEAVAADPAPVVSLGYYFFFASLGVSCCRLPLRATAEATLTPAALVLRFRGGPAYLYFELGRAQWPGPVAAPAAYALRSPARPLAPVGVRYQHGRFGAGGAMPCLLPLSEVATQLSGGLTITAYDAGRQLLSGYYEVRALNQPDPTRAAPEATCTLLLAGDFTNVRLQLE